MSLTPAESGSTATVEQAQQSDQTSPAWVTVVWDDPVNLMSYVTFVFCDYFKYDRDKAERLMMQVHNEGKAAVSSGTREKMEQDVNAMQGFGLWASLEQG